MTGTRYTLEVRPQIPERLAGLHELANNLIYSWDRRLRSLFARLDFELWNTCGHNPKIFLRRVSQEILDKAVEDRLFIEDYNRVMSAYASYQTESHLQTFEAHLNPEQDLVAYFCAEFGFHESFPIYSGGLGILAGDHCKAASDLGLPFVAFGLLYRQGYFTQTIDGHGNQVAHFTPANFADLPVELAKDQNGKEIQVSIDFPQRKILLRVWKAKAGHIQLYLLDSDIGFNTENDRRITYQLYGGDIHTRIQQEIVLGIGGVRALRALGLKPTAWHINEGHSAFQLLERCHELCLQGLDFNTAWEYVAASTVFTTHTPVAAGHDMFEHALMEPYFRTYGMEMRLPWDQFLSLGAYPARDNIFNMTALALRGSRFHNGVSRIHGQVASKMESYIWPQIPPNENPLGYVTNGVHLPTFLAWEWANLFYRRFGAGWRNELCNNRFWECIDDIPDHSYWSLHQSLKSLMLEDVNRRATKQLIRNGCSQAQMERITLPLRSHDVDFLVIGFARRFATYKRATLLFSDPERLKRILNIPGKPVLLIFAGKAHPNDRPGQQLIKTIHDFAHQPGFAGKILLLEGYDLALARKLVTGVDVWLNTPEYPLEASGTSGQKAGINGVINLSVLDGWWGEGYTNDNGWAITPHDTHFDATYRDKEEANDLLNILEHQVIPLYYSRNGYGYSEQWVKKSKTSMKSILPSFNAQRMVSDYIKHYYGPAAKQHLRFVKNDYAAAEELALWKKKINEQWHQVKIRRIDDAPLDIPAGTALPILVVVHLGGLNEQDVVVECLVGTESNTEDFSMHSSHRLKAYSTNDLGETLFSVDLEPSLSGLQFYKIRVFPHHHLLSHRFETGKMIWL